MGNLIKFTATRLQAKGKSGIIKPDADGYYDLVIGALNSFNSAGEYYTLEGAKQLFENSSSFMLRVKNGYLKGELGHPKMLPGMTMNDYVRRILTIDEKNISTHFKEIWLDYDYGKQNPQNGDTNMVAIRAKLKPAGPQGPYLKQSLEDPNDNVSFSIRALTKDYVARGQTFRVLTNIVTWDQVAAPGIAIANKWDSPATESFENIPITEQSLKTFIREHSTVAAMESSVAMAHEILSTLTESRPAAKKPLYSKW